jgi:undecaprenyl-diphosphatase
MVAIDTRPASAATLRGFAGGVVGAATFDPASNALLGSTTMTPVQAGILGILQGLSEFLPISSSAHLALAHWWFGWGDPEANVPFDVALHLGTLIAVVLYFRAELVRLATGTLRALTERHATAEAKEVGVLVLATIPAAALGLPFKHVFERMHDWPPLIAMALAGVGLLLFAVDRSARGERTEPGPGRGVLIGVAQSTALIPGVSRSGASIIGGLIFGLTRTAAVRFSFLLSIPTILGAVIVVGRHITNVEPRTVLIGMAFAAVSGYAAIGFMLRHVRMTGLWPYALYRIALAAVVLALWFTKSGAG